MTNHKRGFLTPEAAEAYQIQASITPPFSRRSDRSVWVTDYLTRAGGRVYVSSYWGRSKAGKLRTYYASYVGA